MQIGLFIPCYIDQFYPQVGLATVEVLERHGVTVDYPTTQTCCGQPLANTGCLADAKPLAEQFYRIFQNYEYVVCPSGSCTSMVRHHYEQFFPGDKAFEKFSHRVYELCEFLTDVLHIERIEGQFPHRVGVHQSCHGLRELRLGKSSEMVVAPFSKAHKLLSSLEGIQFSELKRPDECCGFGGTFAVAEEAVSCMMGQDRVADHEQAGTEVLTALDMSCLMHLDGLIRRDGKRIRVMHVAEILAGRAV
ncbi:MAG: (Fe-S)-binding protein, partial [Planctomycetes bacterium]|nr:(Fe-S)-binding protein [Planctomycetota bacterium]